MNKNFLFALSSISLLLVFKYATSCIELPCYPGFLKEAACFTMTGVPYRGRIRLHTVRGDR
jgi:hypothetical protein